MKTIYGFDPWTDSPRPRTNLRSYKQLNLNKFICNFAKVIPISILKQSYAKNGDLILNMLHAETDADNQKIFDYLKKIGLTSSVSVHLKKEDNGKTKVYFSHA